MGRSTYVPDRGDVVWLEFNPQAGHEQAGHHPALVLSPAAYNRRSGLMLCCPMTTRKKGYPFEVILGETADGETIVLADQIKSLDWRARKAVKKDIAPIAAVEETLSKLHTLL
jgi:mRNA interferase MazF